jgi:hypothetical protein
MGPVVRPFATAVLVLGLLAGCGGGGGGDRLSTEDFRQQADAICAEFEGRLDALEPPASAEDLGRFVREAIPIIEEGNAELNALNPPEEFEARWNRAMEINDANLETVRELRDAIQEGNNARAQELFQEVGANEDEVNGIARELGLMNCGSEDE